MVKFEAGKTYSIKHTFGAYTFVYEFKIDEVKGSSVCGTISNYCIDAAGNRLNGSTANALTRVRKAPNENYQMTIDLPEKFYAI